MDAAETSRAPTRNEIAKLLADGPFASAAARDSALVVAAGSPLAAVFATTSALNVFGARDLAALNATLFEADSPGARRLKGLAHTLPLGAAPRLESLRFYRGRLPLPVGWLCARVAGHDGDDWLVAAAPVRPIEPSEPAPPGEGAPPAALVLQASAPPAPEPPPFIPMPIDGPVRFLWSADGEGRFGAADAALAARLGEHAPGAGETLVALRERVALDPAERWAEAIAARRTFSGLRLAWPEPGGERARVVLLSGAPVMDRERGFAGFRGFGVFTGESVSLAKPDPARARPPETAEALGETESAPVAESASPLPEPVGEDLDATVSAAPAGPPVAEPNAMAELSAALALLIPPRAWTDASETTKFPAAATESESPNAVLAPARETPSEAAALASAPTAAPVDGGAERSDREPISAIAPRDVPATRAEPESDESRISLLEPDLVSVMAALAPAPRLEESLEAPASESPMDDPAPTPISGPETRGATARDGALDTRFDESPAPESAPVPEAMGETDYPPRVGDRDEEPADPLASSAAEPAAAPPEPVAEIVAGAPSLNDTHPPASDAALAAPPASQPESPPTATDSGEPAEHASRVLPASGESTTHVVDAGAPAAAPEPARTVADDVSQVLAKFGREGGAEIFLLRPANAPAAAAPNVVPFRSGPPGASAPAGEPSDPSRRPGDSVELSSHERDAFREIARTLGVRPRGTRSETDGAETPPVETTRPPRADGAAEAADHDVAALIEHLPIGALVMRSGAAIYLNRTLLELLGYSTLAEFSAAGGLDNVFRGRDPASLLGESGDLPLVAADGELMNVDAHARSIAWGGEPAILIAIRRARGLEHQAELRVVEREALAHAATARDLTAALDLASDGMIRLDGAGRILAMNERAETLLGYDQKEAAGESFLMLFAPASQPEATAALERVVSAAGAPVEPPALELVARERGGRPIPTRVDFGRLRGAGDPEYFVLLHDLSRQKSIEREREAAREAAEKASARKTEFLARVSHEIRTPLHAILGFAEVIIEERFGPIGNERYKDYVKDIHASGRHVMSLANDLLDLSKIEAGKMELQFAPVDANRIIRECVALMQPQAARERIIMRLSLFDKLPNVMADERSLRQIMLNLMSNAVKFNEPGGQVIISTALDDAGHSVIRVRDTGLGMNETELGVALEPFRRVSGKSREGTGLGLPLTKALVEANHADFSIKSRKEQGTLVEVAFPRARAAQ